MRIRENHTPSPGKELFPLPLALGTGAQIIQNMAISILGGLTFAILVNLYVIPLLLHWWNSIPLLRIHR